MLHGRAPERARLDQVIAGAVGSRGGALVVRGEPGVGKTALLTDVAERSSDLTVLWTAGIESESPLAFTALHRLLRPVLGQVKRIPPVQSRALRRAFGEIPSTVGDPSGDGRFLVFAATLSLLAVAAEERPVLCIVDDAHWLDAASAEALLFVARRLSADRIGLLFAAREGEGRRFEALGLPELAVSGLDADAASALLAEHAAVPMSDAVRDELHSRTGGNPLALLEVPGVLSEDQLTGRVRLPARLPLTQGVERAFLDRCHRLSDEAQALLLAAAADDSGRLSIVRQAAAGLGAGNAALDAAELSGLIQVRDDELRLRHPLVRSAVYAAATTARRQRAHRELAAALAAAGDRDRSTWHAALGAGGPDEDVAADLDAVAEHATARGGHDAACAALERAAELSAAPEARARRLLAAALSAWLAGNGPRARILAENARKVTDDPLLRADADRLRGRIEWHTGSPQIGRRIILHAARDIAGADLGRAVEMGMLATTLATWGAGASSSEDREVPLPALDDAAPLRLRCFAALLRGHRHILDGEMQHAAGALREAFRLAEALPPDADLLANLGIGAWHIDEVEVVMRSYGALLDLARDTGAATTAVVALSRLPAGELALGEWSAAAASANEALVLARGIGQVRLTALPLAWLALLAALRDETSTALEELETLRAQQPLGIVTAAVDDLTEWAKGVSAATASDSQGALRHLARMQHPTIARMAAVDRVDAAVRAERPDLARTWIDELAAFAAAVGAPWTAAAAEHGRALLSGPETAEGHFQEALRLHDSSGRPFGRARTQLAYGELLRRSRRRIDARAPLREALDVFADLRAEHFAERARQELRASGETARRRNGTTAGDLTPQERQTALLVRSGLDNREIAARLFLSPRTVEYHLSNAYQKLGIRSRTQLARLTLS